MELSPTQLEYTRQHPQYNELFLTIFSPTTALECRVSGSALSNGARSIPYLDVTEGSYLSVEPGMTMLVGTGEGLDDLGKIRVKSATSSTITVAENSDIDWSSATHLKVLRYWEVWPVYPRIIQDPNNETDVIFYKDYDIVYTDQNSVLGAFACAGNHKAGFIGDTLYWSATGTAHLVSGTSLSYEWAFEGGTPTGSSSATPGNVTYNTAGDFVTRLIVTGDNGSEDITYRYVSIRNRVGTSSTNIPIRKWEISSLDGSRGEGGYTASIKIIDEVLTSLRDGDVVMLWSNDYYGSVNTSLGGNSPGNSKIFFVGHVVNGSITYDYKTKITEFEVSSITDTMKEAEGFAITLEDTSTPTKWFQMLDMDGKRAMYHYLKWHSTVLSIADFQFVGTDRKIQYFDSDRESIFDAVDNYMREALVGSVVADRQGKLWAEVGAWVYPNPVASFDKIQDITKRDWIGRPSIEVRNSKPLSYLETGGVAYWGSQIGTFSALLSAAPGITPGTRGTPERLQGLALDSQNQLNRLTGNLYANKVSKYPRINMDLSGKMSQFDVAPQEAVRVLINAEDTNLNENLTAPYLIDSMSWQYNPGNHTLLPSISLISLVNGDIGETIQIPDVPDDGGFEPFPGGGGWIGFPPIPPFIGTPILGQPSDVVLSSSKGVFYTNTFDSSAPLWLSMNAGIDTEDYEHVVKMIATPSGAIWIMTWDSSVPPGRYMIYRAPAIGQAFEKVLDSTVDALYPASLDFDPESSDTVYVVCRIPYNPFVTQSAIYESVGGSAFSIVTEQKFTSINLCMFSVVVYEGKLYWFGSFNAAGDPEMHVYTTSGGAVSSINLSITPFQLLRHHKAVLCGDRILNWFGTGYSKINPVSNTIDTFTLDLSPAGANGVEPTPQGIAMDESGQYGMGGFEGGGAGFIAYQTTDGAATFQTVSGFVPNGSDVWERVDSSSFVFGGGMIIRLTMDRGMSVPFDKMGNILLIAPLLDITGIRVIG